MKNKQEESDLWSEERRFWESGCTCICGADEAGAGPLAGPVYAAAVILPPGTADSRPERFQEADCPAAGDTVRSDLCGSAGVCCCFGR